jgi:DNA-binding FadR family transcriptional regulator
MIFTLPDPADHDGGFVTGTLGSRVARKLRLKIQEDGLAPGTRLPSEQAMALHFRVSRSVVREAIAALKDEGILSTRKGSGAFILRPDGPNGGREDEQTQQSVQSLLNLIEVRRGFEAETAALAALRRTPGQLADIEHALLAIEEAVAAGVSGVEEDVRFHLSIAEATGNPYWVKFIEMCAQPIRKQRAPPRPSTWCTPPSGYARPTANSGVATAANWRAASRMTRF